MLNSETAPAFQLRPYQQDCLRAILNEYRAGFSYQLLDLATGAGKGVIAASIPRLMKLGEGKLAGKKLIFFVHRENLLLDITNRFRRNNPGLKVGLEQNSSYADADCDIICASVQTLGINSAKRTKNRPAANAFMDELHGAEGDAVWSNDRLSRFNPDDFRAVLCDEAHHAAAPQYAPLWRYFGVYLPEPQYATRKLFLGMSATCFRGDNIGLNTIFQKISYSRPILTCIEAGDLVDVDAYEISTEVSIDNVKKSGGELSLPELEKTINTPMRNRLVVNTYKRLGNSRPAIGFVVDIQHGTDLASTFAEAGIEAKLITYKTPKAERDDSIARFLNFELPVLISPSLLAEGSDLPPATVALLARPVLSRGFITQMIGRVLRPYPAPEAVAAMRAAGQEPRWIKEKALVLSFVDATQKHNLASVNTLFGIPPKLKLDKSVVEAAKEIQQIKMAKPGVDLTKFLDLATLRSSARKVNIFGQTRSPREILPFSQFLWFKVDDDEYVLRLPNSKQFNDSYMIRTNALGAWEILSSKNGIMKLIQRNIPTMGEAVQATDKLVPTELRANMRIGAIGNELPPTSKQIAAYAQLFPEERKKFKTWDEFYRNTEGKFNRKQMNMALMSRRPGAPSWFKRSYRFPEKKKT